MNLMHNLSSVYIVKHLYMFRAHHQEVHRMDTTNVTPTQPGQQTSSIKNNKYQLFYPYCVPPDDRL